jgi:uncharacterized protein YuzB (UPF0349 family)
MMLGYGKKRSWPVLRFCCNNCPEGLRKTLKNLDKDSQVQGKELISGLPKCEPGLLTTKFDII